MQHDLITDAVDRFNTVFSARTSFKEQLRLIELLKTSTKFDEAVKPFCYYRLLQLFLPKRLTADQMLSLLNQLPEFGVMALLRATLDGESVDQLRAMLIRKVLSVEKPSPQSVRLMHAAIRAELAASRGELFSLALGANMPYAEADVLAEVTFEAWHQGNPT